jgi:hypothetical protein
MLARAYNLSNFINIDRADRIFKQKFSTPIYRGGNKTVVGIHSFDFQQASNEYLQPISFANRPNEPNAKRNA